MPPCRGVVGGVARLGVLGGTFDPIHLGHLILAEQAREQLRLDRVLFIPAGDPWRKSARKIAPAKHRLAMVELAVAGNDAFVFDDRELRRAGPTYTVETLRELRAGLQVNDEIYFILGADALADLPNWRDPAGLADVAMLAVAPREGVAAPALPIDASRVVRIEMPLIDISSTELRKRARQGRSLRYLVPDAVEAYIRDHGLYQA